MTKAERAHRHRLFRGGHRQANPALYRIVTVRIHWHQATIDYVTKRTAQGLSKKDIIRCLKRFSRARSSALSLTTTDPGSLSTRPRDTR